MPLIDFTVSGYLIPLVRSSASLSKNDGNFTDDVIISFLNDELQTYVVPQIMGVNEEFLVTNYDVPFGAVLDRIVIPTQTMVSQLRYVQFLSSSGDPSDVNNANNGRYTLARVDPSLIGEGTSSGVVLPVSAYGVAQCGYYLEDNAVVFYPSLTQAAGFTAIRLSFFRRPNDLVLNTECVQVASVNTTTGVITTSTPLPGSWSTATPFDVVGHDTPFTTSLSDVTATAASGSSITVPTTSPGLGSVMVGDWLCLTGTSPIAQVIREASPLLVAAAVVRCMKAKKDMEGYNMAKTDLAEARQRLINNITPRVNGQPKKIVNPYTLFQRSSVRFGRWRS